MKSNIKNRLDKLNAILDDRIPPLELEYIDGVREKANWIDVLALTFTEEYDRRPVKAIYYSPKLKVMAEFFQAAMSNKEIGEDMPYLIEL